MTKNEALKLALEVMETYKSFIDDAHIIEGQWHWIDGLDTASTDIKKALAQPEHIPDAGKLVMKEVSLPEQEPVGVVGAVPGYEDDFTHCIFASEDVPAGTKIYTTPPKRKEWVGLNWGDLLDEWVGDTKFLTGARWAEQILKEKNA